jgi:beta-galactosidase
VCRHGLDLGDGTVMPLWSGALHYWRVPQPRWDETLAAVRDLGFAAVETYVPWAVHELAPGEYDFGTRDGQRDLGKFLERTRAAGLKCLLRPGPHINAELTFFGFPERILADPAMQAVTARDTPAFLPAPPRAFPVPSYASRRFLAAAAEWLRAFAEVVRPHLHPDGPVVAIQVDNECGYFFRGGPYDLDYHPDAIARYREFLAARYGDDAGLAAAYGAGATLAGATPPRRFAATRPAELTPHLDWLTFKEELVAQALGELADTLRAAGLGGVPLYHNLPPTDPAGGGLVAIERRLDLCGVDYHHPGRDYDRVRERVLYQAGTSALPYAPELNAGAMAFGPPVTPEEQRDVILNVLMHGLKGANIYMAVDRERWYGAPVGLDGAPRPPLGPFLARLGAALRETGLFTRERAAEVALVLPPCYRRLTHATWLLDAAPPLLVELAGLGAPELCREETFGLAGPVGLEHAAAHRALTAALARGHVPYVIVDGAAPAARLAGYRVLLCPTFDLLDEAVARARVLLGPRAPTLDERLRPLAPPLPLPAPALDAETLGDPARLDALLATLAVARPYLAMSGDVDTALYPAAGQPDVLFVGTRAAAALVAEVALPGAARLVDLITGATLTGAATARIPLEPFGVRLFRVEPDAGGAP